MNRDNTIVACVCRGRGIEATIRSVRMNSYFFYYYHCETHTLVCLMYNNNILCHTRRNAMYNLKMLYNIAVYTQYTYILMDTFTWQRFCRLNVMKSNPRYILLGMYLLTSGGRPISDILLCGFLLLRIPYNNQRDFR